MRALISRRLFSSAPRWSFSAPLTPHSAVFSGAEVYIGAVGSLRLCALPSLKAAHATSPQPCTPPPDEAYELHNNADGVYVYSEGGREVGAMLVARTAHGDGFFEDSAGRSYAVDGGTLAVLSGALVPPELRLMAAVSQHSPFALGHLIPLPAGAQVLCTAKRGRLELCALHPGGQQPEEAPLLVLDTGGGAEEGGEAALGEFGEAADVPQAELLRALQARPGDAALALSACKVTVHRLEALTGEGGDSALQARACEAFLEAGGMQLLRLALEGHHRSPDTAFYGFYALNLLAIPGVRGFAGQAAPLLPTIAGALAAHAGSSGATLAMVLSALGCIVEDPAQAPAAAAAGLPALVAACLRSSLAPAAGACPSSAEEREQRVQFAATALFWLAQVPQAVEGLGAAAALADAARAFPENRVLAGLADTHAIFY